jgi:hypothetical protein
MAHEIAKLLLEHAGTFLERTEAVEIALSMGMPLKEIEDYLDWLDVANPPIDWGADKEGPE